jgi:hypothetical protein
MTVEIAVLIFAVIFLALIGLRFYALSKEQTFEEWKEQQQPFIENHKVYGKDPHKRPYKRKNRNRSKRGTNSNVPGPKNK